MRGSDTPSDTNVNLLGGSYNATASPFVIAITDAGIPALPSIINAVVLISAFSAGNSDLYASSRTLYGLALDRKAPRWFRYCTKRGIPIWSLAMTAAVGLLAYLNVNNSGATVFNWFVSLSTVTGLITVRCLAAALADAHKWWVILLSYIRFYRGLKKQGVNRADFPYRAPFQPYFSCVSFIPASS